MAREGVLDPLLVLEVLVNSTFGAEQGLALGFGPWVGSGVQKSSWKPVMSLGVCILTLEVRGPLTDPPSAGPGICFGVSCSELAFPVPLVGPLHVGVLLCGI